MIVRAMLKFTALFVFVLGLIAALEGVPVARADGNTVTLKAVDSAGNPLVGVAISAYKPNTGGASVGTTDPDGMVTASLPWGGSGIIFTASYKKSSAQVAADVAPSDNPVPLITFQTTTATIAVVDSQGTALPGVDVSYSVSNSGGGSVGTTDQAGRASTELFPGTYAFTARYASSSISANVDIGAEGTDHTFNTTPATIAVTDCNGNPVVGAKVTYFIANSGGGDVGTISGAAPVSTELFPGTYEFRATINRTTATASVNISAGDPVDYTFTPTVVSFQAPGLVSMWQANNGGTVFDGPTYIFPGSYTIDFYQDPAGQTRLLSAPMTIGAAICATGNATLTVNFPGINSVHTYIFPSDGLPGQVGGKQIAAQTWQNNAATFSGLGYGLYDVKVVKGNEIKIIDDVAVISDNSSLDDIVATLTVKFPGISSVHTYVDTADTHKSVDSSTWKTNETTLNVLKAIYQVTVRKGNQNNAYTVDCTGDGTSCNLDGIVSQMRVVFPQISSVHTYVNTFDTFKSVDSSTWKTNETTIPVLRGTYQVVVVKGNQSNTYEVPCTSDCTLKDITATMHVAFPGISSVHTYVRTTGDKDVDSSTWKTGSTDIVVLKGDYHVTVVKGKQSNSYEVGCEDGESCTLSDIVSAMTVNFPGVSGVHVYLKTDDGPGTFNGGDVDSRTWQNNSTTVPVLKAFYDVQVVKGNQQNVYERVDCLNQSACTVDGVITRFTLHFAGKKSVHVYLKTDDGVANTAGGKDVDSRTWQNDKTSFATLRGTYDIVVKIGGETYILDAVDLNNEAATYTLAIVRLLNSGGVGLEGGAVQYYASGWKNLGSTPSSGVLSAALPGALGNTSFAMSYVGARQEKTSSLANEIVVTFQTAPVTIELRDSSGSLTALPSAGHAQYYASGWKEIGDTAGGVARIELLPVGYNFSMSYAGARQEKSAPVAASGATTVTFQTAPVTIELRDSSGSLTALPSAGHAQYYASGWKEIGDTIGGVARIELLPVGYNFSMSYAGARQEKSAPVTASGATTVTFQTGQVTGTALSYYASGWKPFSSGMELLQGSYQFHYSSGPDKSFTISGGQTNAIP